MADEFGEGPGEAVGVGKGGGSSGLVDADAGGMPPIIEIGGIREKSVGVIDDRPFDERSPSSSLSSSSSWRLDGAI